MTNDVRSRESDEAGGAYSPTPERCRRPTRRNQASSRRLGKGVLVIQCRGNLEAAALMRQIIEWDLDQQVPSYAEILCDPEIAKLV